MGTSPAGNYRIAPLRSFALGLIHFSITLIEDIEDGEMFRLCARRLRGSAVGNPLRAPSYSINRGSESLPVKDISHRADGSLLAYALER